MKLKSKNFFSRFIRDFFGAISLLSIMGTASVIIYWLVRLTIYDTTWGTIVSGIVFVATIVAIRVWKEEIVETVEDIEEGIE